MSRVVVYSIGCMLLFIGCFKEEDPRPTIPADVVIELGPTYDNQIYYSLSDNKIVHSFLYEDWDLGFYAQDDKNAIQLNSAKFMFSYNTETVYFDSITEFNENWTARVNHPNGYIDSSALYDVYEPPANIGADPLTYISPFVYVINLGADQLGNPFGFKKIQFTAKTNDSYTIRYANIDGSEESTYTILKDPSKNFVGFSFKNGGQIVENEPDRNTWDLLFTRYTEILYAVNDPETPVPYTVVGVLQNPHLVETAKDSTHNYEDISFETIQYTTFSSDINTIGYDWKVIDINENQFFIYNNISYLIKDRYSNYYKLAFLDFYNEEGTKGYPAFKYEEL